MLNFRAISCEIYPLPFPLPLLRSHNDTTEAQKFIIMPMAFPVSSLFYIVSSTNVDCRGVLLTRRQIGSIWSNFRVTLSVEQVYSPVDSLYVDIVHLYDDKYPSEICCYSAYSSFVSCIASIPHRGVRSAACAASAKDCSLASSNAYAEESNLVTR